MRMCYDGAVSQFMAVGIKQAVQRMNTHDYNQGDYNKFLRYFVDRDHFSSNVIWNWIQEYDIHHVI